MDDFNLKYFAQIVNTNLYYAMPLCPKFVKKSSEALKGDLLNSKIAKRVKMVPFTLL